MALESDFIAFKVKGSGDVWSLDKITYEPGDYRTAAEKVNSRINFVESELSSNREFGHTSLTLTDIELCFLTKEEFENTEF